MVFRPVQTVPQASVQLAAQQNIQIAIVQQVNYLSTIAGIF